MQRRLRLVALLAGTTMLLWTGAADARGGKYVLDGGTARQQQQVHAALQISTFDWSVVPATVTIHLRKGTEIYSKRGEIWLDTCLLDAGAFAWGPIQHEYAHQVDFFLLDDGQRVRLNSALGGKAWSHTTGTAALHGPDHVSLGAERFASTLTWAYWESNANSLRPASKKDESAAMAPGKFRVLLERMLGIPNPSPPVVTVH